MEAQPELAVAQSERTIPFHRLVLMIEDRRDVKELESLICEGWKLDDKWMKPIRTDNGLIVHLIKFTAPTVAKAELKPTFDDEEIGGKVRDYEDVMSLVSVDHDQVDSYLSQGYEINTIYQKNAVLLKRKAKE